MAIKYDFFEVNELNKTQGKYRARTVSNGKITSKKLANWISQTSGLSVAEAKSFIEILTDSIIDFVENGYEVEVGNLGYFSASVTSRLVDSPNEIRAESVRFNKLNFRAGIEVKKRINRAGTERIRRQRNKRNLKKTTRQERAEILKKYMAGQPVITRADYMRLTGIRLKAIAVEDLNTFIKEAWMRKYGAGRTVVYMLKPNLSNGQS
jgi:predicted histone-like DNA-binding protein